MNDKPYFTLRIPIPDRQYLGRLMRWLIPNGGTLILIALLIATQSIWARPFAAMSTPGPSATTVNYQGRLADNAGVPLDGSYAMRFALYDAVTGGALIWGPEIHDAVPVSEGLFSVGLGSQTSGGIPTTVWNGDRYLEIAVGGETLSPRELIRSVPIAAMALTVPDGAIGMDQIANGVVSSAKLGLQSEFRRILTPVDITTPEVFGSGIEIPDTDLTIVLDRPSRILYTAQGVVFYDYLNGENIISLRVNGNIKYSYISKGVSKDTFTIQTFLDLPIGTHNLSLTYQAEAANANLVMQGWNTRSSIGYIVIDQD